MLRTISTHQTYSLGGYLLVQTDFVYLEVSLKSSSVLYQFEAKWSTAFMYLRAIAVEDGFGAGGEVVWAVIYPLLEICWVNPFDLGNFGRFGGRSLSCCTSENAVESSGGE